MTLAREILSREFHNMRFTDSLMSPAWGKAASAAPYCNMLAYGSTEMTQEATIGTLKRLERKLGNNATLRQHDVVMMDLDLMEWDSVRCRASEWERPYVKKLLNMLKSIMLAVLLNLAPFLGVSAQERSQDTELLGRAVEYFHGGKYHECVLMFEKLQQDYRLSPRFLAYLGVSYYKEGQYVEAVSALEKALPSLDGFAPKERAVYTYSCAESLFALQRYRESLVYYEQAMSLTEGNDRGDVLFHTAFAHYLDAPVESGTSSPSDSTVIQLFREALTLYRANTVSATPLQTARRRQCEIMLKGFGIKEE